VRAVSFADWLLFCGSVARTEWRALPFSFSSSFEQHAREEAGLLA